MLGNVTEITVQNCYYLEGKADGAVDGSDTEDAVSRTEAQFGSGETAWLLQYGQEEGVGQVWGQQLKGASKDQSTILTDNGELKVLNVTFAGSNGTELAAAYTNPGGMVELPDIESAVCV